MHLVTSECITFSLVATFSPDDDDDDDVVILQQREPALLSSSPALHGWSRVELMELMEQENEVTAARLGCSTTIETLAARV